MADSTGKHEVNLWMNVSKGKYPNNVELNGAVKVGDSLTLSIYLDDPKNNTDIRVKDCYAYDNEKALNSSSPPLLQLSSEDGCPLKPKLIDPWTRTFETMNPSATSLVYTTINVRYF